jgi:predicted O-linked N-acetylglucosamine transferase (SPINDLY family)
LQGKAQVNILKGNTAEAIAAVKTLLEENPRSDIGIALLASCYASQGDIATALEHLDAGLAMAPDYADLIGRKIFLLDYLPDADFAVQQGARKHWWEAIGTKLPQRALAPRTLDPDKRILIGYVASEFRNHSAAFALLPVLRHHDHARFEIVCYSCSPVRDEMTAAFRSSADVWVDAWQMSDDELADRIQADKVDILIDVSGHTTGNRLHVFARKPAPIQVSGFGHATGTGLQTMDYVLADPVFIPQSARHLLAEKVYDLPCLITIDPILDLPASEPPMLRNGHVTFGVFNRIYKISDEAVRVWSKVMREVTGSKIIIKHTLLDDPMLRDNLVARFVAQGVAEENVTCVGSSPRPEHLRAFANVDISLDTFPQWRRQHLGIALCGRSGRGQARQRRLVACRWFDRGCGRSRRLGRRRRRGLCRDRLQICGAAGVSGEVARGLAGPDRSVSRRQCRDLHAGARGGLPPVLARLLCCGLGRRRGRLTVPGGASLELRRPP